MARRVRMDGEARESTAVSETAAGRRVRQGGSKRTPVESAEAVTGGRRVQPKEVDERVDELHTLILALKSEEEVFKARLKDRKERAAELQEAIIETMKEKGVKRIEGRVAAAVAKARSSGSIDCGKFNRWMKSIGQGKLVLNYMSVGLTKAKGDFGEKVLKDAGVLEVDVNEYSSLDVRSK